VSIFGVKRVGNGNSLGVLVLNVMLFGVNLLVLLEILGAFEGFLTDLKYDERKYYGY
jgi:hypothetical protein